MLTVAVGRQGGPKKAARKSFARTVRRRAVANLFADGKPQTEIATHLGISQKTVSRDVQVVHAELVEDSKDAISRWRDEQIARLEGWRADLQMEWERSKGNAKITRQEMAVDDKNTSTGGKRISVTTHERVGDPRIMEKMLSIEDMIARLRGTYAPSKVAATDPDGNRSMMGGGGIVEGNVLVINVNARDSKGR